jgi:hypothetical protein
VTDNEELTTDIAYLQLLPETEPASHGVHLGLSCHMTCPLFTSDSLPSVCCR